MGEFRWKAAARSVRWPLLALVALFAFNALATPGFFAIELRNGRFYGVLFDILNHGSRIAIVALGMTLVIATRGVDLSVGAVAAIGGAVAARLVRDAGCPWPVAVALAVGAATILGTWNGLLVTALRLQPIVATLVLMVAGRGIAQLATDGLIVTFDNPGLAFLGNGAVLGLPLPALLLAGVLALVAIGVRKSNLGLFLESVGGNAAASRLAGVPDRRIVLLAYAFCGACAGLAGVIECSYIKAADANNAGQLLELDTILAVVIGGTALSGGRFSLLGSVVGAMILQTLSTTLYMQDVSAEVAPAPKALGVLLVCAFQSPTVHARFGRRRGSRRTAG
jgi:simple sugar transport system permease protein